MLDLLTRRLHVRQRAAGAALRHPERLRQPLPPRDAAGTERRGLLGQGSILTVTSYPNRTSPVLRGKWILENILGTPPSPPPPNVDPTLDENKPARRRSRVRALLEQHRRNPDVRQLPSGDGPARASRWRTSTASANGASRKSGGAIDPDRPAGRRQRRWTARWRCARPILKQPEMFVRTLTEKLMTYGLGRGVEHKDKPHGARDRARRGAQNYRFSSIVLGIVKSAPFQMKKARPTPPTARARRRSRRTS